MYFFPTVNDIRFKQGCNAIMCILIGIMGFSLNGGSTKTTRIVSADEALYAQFTDSDQLEGISGMDVDTYRTVSELYLIWAGMR